MTDSGKLRTRPHAAGRGICQESSENVTGHDASLKSHVHMCRPQHMAEETQKQSRCTTLNPERKQASTLQDTRSVNDPIQITIFPDGLPPNNSHGVPLKIANSPAQEPLPSSPKHADRATNGSPGAMKRRQGQCCQEAAKQHPEKRTSLLTGKGSPGPALC